MPPPATIQQPVTPSPYPVTPSLSPTQIPPEPGSVVSTPPKLPISPAQTITPAPTPIQFNIPTTGPMPVSIWRPALYPVPWALNPMDHFYFARPIAADVVNWPDAEYRYGSNLFGDENIHTGIDIPAKTGTPVLAAGSGKIVWAGYGLYRSAGDTKDPYGQAITILHDFSYRQRALYTIYAHLDRIDVVVGQVVKIGEPIGAVGSTGQTTGPHLHFEVRIEQSNYFTTLNPELWLVPPQGWGVLVGRVTNIRESPLTAVPIEVRKIGSNQKWKIFTYAKQTINSDPYFRENAVLSDLPAGLYEVSLTYHNDLVKIELEIRPGVVTYFSFKGESYFSRATPDLPGFPELMKTPIFSRK
ncbi:MAG TPA: peptidoglycan DD-metalloendopeptidase family protein [Anaerolineaceae bacterium]